MCGLIGTKSKSSGTMLDTELFVESLFSRIIQVSISGTVGFGLGKAIDIADESNEMGISRLTTVEAAFARDGT